MLTLHKIVSNRMKLSGIPKTNINNKKSGFLPPPITLACSAYKDLQKDNYLTRKLWSIPHKSNSRVYKRTIPYSRMEHPRNGSNSSSTFKKKAIVGQDLTVGPTQFAIARWWLVWDTLSQFDKRATEIRDTAVAAVPEGMAVSTNWTEMATNLKNAG